MDLPELVAESGCLKKINMKHFINIFVLLILVGFIVGVTFLQITYGEAWFIGYIPLLFASLFLGNKISRGLLKTNKI